eukprot:6202921-Pleurochrysis_carterae.AAC.4
MSLSGRPRNGWISKRRAPSTCKGTCAPRLASGNARAGADASALQASSACVCEDAVRIRSRRKKTIMGAAA